MINGLVPLEHIILQVELILDVVVSVGVSDCSPLSLLVASNLT